MNDVGILLVDDDIATGRALKQFLDSEGWRVRIVPLASVALAELATGAWNLAIVNISLAGPQTPLFATLRELSRVQAPPPGEAAEGAPKLFRTLFLVPINIAKDVGPYLEKEALPYSLKPYHLHDFLEKVSELLQETGAIQESLRGIGGFSGAKKRSQPARAGRGGRGAMFAPREAYQMTEEEISEYERQEEEDRRKKRKKGVLDSPSW